MNSFSYTTYPQQIIFGAGAIKQMETAVSHLSRLFLLTSPSLRSSGFVAKLETALGSRLIATFDRTAPHVQDTQLAEVVEMAKDLAVDGVIGMGGGSPIGLAKALGHTMQPHLPIIAIPSTYAGSEMTSIFGITHHLPDETRKITVKAPHITPQLVIYDPELTLNLPPHLTAGTGINALAHCIEALYSITRNPLSTAVSLQGIHTIYHTLPLCVTDGQNLAARTNMLRGAHLAGASLATADIGLHHGLCHTLGGTAGLPHGVANSIMLPHAIQFNADMVAAQLAPAANLLGITGFSDEAKTRALAEKLFVWIGRLGMPQRLRDRGVEETLLSKLAEIALKSSAVQKNPKPVSLADAKTVFHNAW